MIKKLMTIQKELKAPKNQFNSFGKYKYRSCEDILEAVKPLLAKQGCVLTLSDEVVEIGGRVYVKATATLSSDDLQVTTTAYARETEDKKGMDPSQCTGTASSYARKYCLSGLLLLDDTQDADEHTKQTTKKEKEKPEAPKETYREKIYEYVEGNGLDMKDFAAEHGLSRSTTEDEFKALYEKLGGK